jgi:hypothetical protein
MGRIGTDITDQTQQNLFNSRSTDYMLSNYFSEIKSDNHVNFATSQPTMNFAGIARGNGLNGDIIDYESYLTLKVSQDRHYEKLQLIERPFLTIPYLGRGSRDPALESQLQQGEIVSDKKSVSTIMDKSFADYALYPTDNNMNERVQNPAFTVEEAALDGWIRGGKATREMSSDEDLKKNNRPSSSFF